jgi:putative membrane protein insertion efficiency factor
MLNSDQPRLPTRVLAFGFLSQANLQAVIRFPFIFAIRAYQALHTSFFVGHCRFHPTCSHYALEAIESHGVLKGGLLSAYRILRCQPFCKGGFDPVPETKRSLRGT